MRAGRSTLTRRLAAAAVLALAGVVAVSFAAWRRLDTLLPRAVEAAAASAGLALATGGVTLPGGWELLLDDVAVRGSGGARLLEAERVRATPTLGLWPPRVRIDLTVQDARIEAGEGEGSADVRLAALSLPAIVSSLAFSGLRVDLGAGSVVEADLVAGTGPAGGLGVRVDGLAWSDEASGFAAENLRGEVALGPVGLQGERRLRVRVEEGAALAGPVFLDFASSPFSLDATVREADDAAIGPEAASGSFSLEELVVSLRGLLDARGLLVLGADGGARRASLEVSTSDLSPAFVAFVRDPFGGVAPSISDASLGGSMKLELDYEPPAADASRPQGAAAVDRLRSLRARLRVQGGSLRTRSLEVRGLEFDIPWIGASSADRGRRPGRVRATELSMFDLPLGSIEVELEATPERLSAKAPFSVQAFGGRVHFAAAGFERLAQPAQEGPRLSADLRVEDVDLARLGEAVGVDGMSGILAGDLGRVRLDASALAASGGLRASVFGGSVALSRMALLEPFSRVPTLALDAVLEDIDLEALTATLPFGSVRGVLEGSVSGLRVAAGQPVSFEADLSSVHRRGVDQTIDVRAITQLGVLGGGDGGSLTGTLLKVFDRYRYSRLGIRCRLHNDVFEVRGVEREGGRDYLVRGGLLPPTVNVVSHSQVVSFSEMLRRIERMTALGQGEDDDGT